MGPSCAPLTLTHSLLRNLIDNQTIELTSAAVSIPSVSVDHVHMGSMLCSLLMYGSSWNRNGCILGVIKQREALGGAHLIDIIAIAITVTDTICKTATVAS